MVGTKQPFDECWLVKSRKRMLTGSVESRGKRIRENTQILVGKSDGKKQRRKYVAVGGRIILKCVFK
jgi:hypothetical protein